MFLSIFDVNFNSYLIKIVLEISRYEGKNYSNLPQFNFMYPGRQDKFNKQAEAEPFQAQERLGPAKQTLPNTNFAKHIHLGRDFETIRRYPKWSDIPRVTSCMATIMF